MNEADIQVLVSIRRAEVHGESCDRVNLENGADRYWKYLEDWSGSWQRLLGDGLIQGDASSYTLTERGRPPAQAMASLHSVTRRKALAQSCYG